MCDRIREEDDRTKQINELLEKSGCKEIKDINTKLNDCLKTSNRDWRLCKV